MLSGKEPMGRIGPGNGNPDDGEDDQASSARRVLRAEGFVEKAFAIIRADLMSLRSHPDITAIHYPEQVICA